MLTTHSIHRRSKRHSQRGIAMIVAMIVLVAMTLGAVALTRSVFTSNLIAGNLAFQKAATTSTDIGVENAIAWLETKGSLTTTSCASGTLVLACDDKNNGYSASQQDPAAGETWADFWKSRLDANGYVKTLTKDDAGNTASYVIQRMCNTQGDPGGSGIVCSTSPNSTGGTCAGGSSCDTQGINLFSVSQVYYRITVRVQGPNNTTSFVQAMVVM